MKKYMRKYVKKIKEHIDAIKETKTSPLSIATGFAIATFLSILPTFGTAIFIGIFLIAIFKRLNKYSLFIGFAVWNPFVLAPIFGICNTVGTFFMPEVPTKVFKIAFFNEIYRYSIQFMIGNLVLAMSLSILSFIVVYSIAKIYSKITHSSDQAK